MDGNELYWRIPVGWKAGTFSYAYRVDDYHDFVQTCFVLARAELSTFLYEPHPLYLLMLNRCGVNLKLPGILPTSTHPSANSISYHGCTSPTLPALPPPLLNLPDQLPSTHVPLPLPLRPQHPPSWC